MDNKSSRGLHVVYKDVEFYCIVYDENCELTPWVGRERSSFVFDGGIVGLKPRWIDSLSHHSELGVPMYIDPSVFKEPMRIRRMRIQKYIDEISEEVYMKISSTHHRLTKEDLQKLKR